MTSVVPNVVPDPVRCSLISQTPGVLGITRYDEASALFIFQIQRSLKRLCLSDAIDCSSTVPERHRILCALTHIVHRARQRSGYRNKDRAWAPILFVPGALSKMGEHMSTIF